jgi:hypothetical protein
MTLCALYSLHVASLKSICDWVMFQCLVVASTCISFVNFRLAWPVLILHPLEEMKYQTRLTLFPIPHFHKSFNMLPPVDPTIVASVSKFEALYRDLTTNKLSKDGSSRLDVKAQRERDTLREV